jgi:xanthine/CO dehydrogenase XdhC/CoxF family maturation factor
MDIDIYTEIARLKSEGKEVALVTLISASGSTPRGEGAKMMVMEDGSIKGSIGGGNIENEVIQAALEVIRKGKPQRFKYELKKADEGVGMICGGDVEVFIRSPSLMIGQVMPQKNVSRMHIKPLSLTLKNHLMNCRLTREVIS